MRFCEAIEARGLRVGDLWSMARGEKPQQVAHVTRHYAPAGTGHAGWIRVSDGTFFHYLVQDQKVWRVLRPTPPTSADAAEAEEAVTKFLSTMADSLAEAAKPAVLRLIADLGKQPSPEFGE